MEIELLDPGVPGSRGGSSCRGGARRKRGELGRTRSRRSAAPTATVGQSVPRSNGLRPPGHREPGGRICAACAPRELGPHLVLLARDMSRLPQPVPAGQRRASGRHQGRAALHPRAARRGTPKAWWRSRAAATARSRGGCWPATGKARAAGCAGAWPRRVFGDRSSSSSSTTSCPTTTGWSPRLARLADELGLPTVVTNDAHYACPRIASSRTCWWASATA